MSTIEHVSLGRIAAAGAIGGAANGLIVLAGAVAGIADYLEWHIVLAVAAQGTILAMFPPLAARWLSHYSRAIRVAAAPLVGYIAGYGAVVAIAWSLNEGLEFDVGSPWWGPLAWWGVTSSILYLWLALRATPTVRSTAIAVAWLAATAGYATFWIFLDIHPHMIDARTAAVTVLEGAAWGIPIGLALTARRTHAAAPRHPASASQASPA